ncbi:hypothetical protein AB0K89_22955 [Streptomyces cinnamoneus]|uniref:hypothetical protein n=1 Tax=Streptomyces cinnamoneus TaxID=53446 RepID=UPI00344A0832
MNITSRILAVAAASGALLAATGSAHAADGLNLVNVKRVPGAVASAIDTSANNVVTSIDHAGVGSDDGVEEDQAGFGLFGILLHPDTIYAGQDSGFVIETLERNIN